MDMQHAELTGRDGKVETVEVPAFPNYPEVVTTVDGHVFVANNPAVGYGTSALGYHQVETYNLEGD